MQCFSCRLVFPLHVFMHAQVHTCMVIATLILRLQPISVSLLIVPPRCWLSTTSVWVVVHHARCSAHFPAHAVLLVGVAQRCTIFSCLLTVMGGHQELRMNSGFLFLAKRCCAPTGQHVRVPNTVCWLRLVRACPEVGAAVRVMCAASLSKFV